MEKMKGNISEELIVAMYQDALEVHRAIKANYWRITNYAMILFGVIKTIHEKSNINNPSIIAFTLFVIVTYLFYLVYYCIYFKQYSRYKVTLEKTRKKYLYSEIYIATEFKPKNEEQIKMNIIQEIPKFILVFVSTIVMLWFIQFNNQAYNTSDGLPTYLSILIISDCSFLLLFTCYTNIID